MLAGLTLPQRALYLDAFVTCVGSLSGSTYSLRSFLPRSPLALHHVRKLLVLLIGFRGVLFAHFGHPLGLTLLVRLSILALHACLHFKHFHFAL